MYERSQSFGEIFVVGQLIERPRPVFIYEECHLGCEAWMVEGAGCVFV